MENNKDLRQRVLAINELGNTIGFGELMHLASSIWRYKLKPQGIETGAFVPTIVNFIKDDPEIQDIIHQDIRVYDRRVESILDNE